MKKLARSRPLIAALAVAMGLALVAGEADARAGMGRSYGSRGSRTYAAPPPTMTSPGAAPITRSYTPTPSQTMPGAGYGRTGGFFRPGFGTGIMAGLLGAGLFGMLFGHGLFGGIGGFGSMLGLLLQLVLIFFLVRWALRWWQRRNQPAYAGMSRDAGPAGGPAPGPIPGFGGGRAERVAMEPLQIERKDLDEFERLLSEIQLAYGREDMETLRRIATPEMASYMQEELAENARRGLVNRLSGVRLLQGDLSEAWREGDVEYATVAMRYHIDDVLVRRSTGEVVEHGPSEVVELWTFARPRGGYWELSAVQQQA